MRYLGLFRVCCFGYSYWGASFEGREFMSGFGVICFGQREYFADGGCPRLYPSYPDALLALLEKH